jgi:photosystem II stability/assembly factor-like uncharacterized protein
MRHYRFIYLLLSCVILIQLSGNARAQWIQTNGPYGAKIRTFALSGSKLFTGTSGGVFSSTDNGKSWSRSGLIDTSVTSIITVGSTLFAGTYGDGIFRSTNDGASWTPVDSGLGTANSYVTALGSSASNIYAGFDNGVFLSTDYGNSWKSVGFSLPNSQTPEIKALAIGGKYIFAGISQNGLYLSTNSGRNWKSVSTAMANSTVRALLMKGSTIYAGTDSDIFISTDNGTSWNFASGNLPRRVNINALASSGTNIFAATDSSGIFISSDSGVSWIPIDSGLDASQTFTVFTNGIDLFAGTPVGVFHSDTYGYYWAASNAGLMGIAILNISGSGKVLYAATNAGSIFSTTDQGEHWVEADNGLPPGGSIYTLSGSNDNVFCILFPPGPSERDLFLSTNAGKEWKKIGSDKVGYNNDVAVIGETFLIATDSGVFSSFDHGLTWPRVSNISSAAGLSITNTNVYAWGSDYIYRSSDSGKHWAPIDTATSTRVSFYGFTVTEEYIFALIRTSAHNIGPSLFISKIDSNNWNYRSNLFDFPYTSLGKISFGVNGYTVFEWLDSVGFWIPVDSSLNTYIFTLHTADSFLYAGTESSGIWKRTLSDFTASSGWINVPGRLDFDNTPVGDTECKTIEIRNIGNIPFTLQSYSITSDTEDYYIDPLQFPIVIKPKDSVKIKICFTPHAEDLYYPRITWLTDIPSESKGLYDFLTYLYGSGAGPYKVVDNDKSGLLSLFPNPTTGFLTIGNLPDDLRSISIVNVFGERVMEILKPQGSELTMDLSKFPAAVYFVKFSSANGSITRKVIRE